MKILYTITGLSMGGAETITANLAARMHGLGHAVKILYLSGVQVVQIPGGIEAINLHLRKTPLGFIAALFKAKNIIKAYSPDVVHANMFHAILFSRLLRLVLKIPRLICTEHSNNFHGRLRLFLEHCTDFLSDLNTNVSESATAYFIKSGVFSKKKTIAMYNGIDMKRFVSHRNRDLRKQLGLADTDFVFINISRFNEAKDHKTLLHAFDIVHKKNQNAKLLLVGDGELRAEIQNLVQYLSLSSSVLFAGIQQNTQDYYNASECFVLSSAYEGFGLVLVEAMACELPVISTDCGGTKEIVAHKHDLVPIKNPDALAEKMIAVMELSGDERERIGRENRATVGKFDLEKITEKWETLYEGNSA